MTLRPTLSPLRRLTRTTPQDLRTVLPPTHPQRALHLFPITCTSNPNSPSCPVQTHRLTTGLISCFTIFNLRKHCTICNPHKTACTPPAIPTIYTPTLTTLSTSIPRSSSHPKSMMALLPSDHPSAVLPALLALDTTIRLPCSPLPPRIASPLLSTHLLRICIPNR